MGETSIFSKMNVSTLVIAAFLFCAQGHEPTSYGVVTYVDSSCRTIDKQNGNSFTDYRLTQDVADKHCYSHNGYSIKPTCGSDDTVTVNHWFDATGMQAACTGQTIAGEPLMKSI